MFLDLFNCTICGHKPMSATSEDRHEFFWDLPLGYIDIVFDIDGKNSIFSRSKNGVEYFHETDTINDDFINIVCIEIAKLV